VTFWSKKDQNWTPNWTPFCDQTMREIDGHFLADKSAKKESLKNTKKLNT
jgi:hypothetical protein